MLDPTREELIAFLQDHYSETTCEPIEYGPHSEATWDIEEAAYWLASNFHGGQWSSLYAALSTSPFSPGASANGPEYGADASLLYAAGAKWIEGN